MNSHQSDENKSVNTTVFKPGQQIPSGEHGGYSGTYSIQGIPAVGCYSRIGTAGKDEDYVTGSHLPFYGMLFYQQQKDASELTFQILQEAFGEPNVGSTGCFAAVRKTHNPADNKTTIDVNTTNLGDSSAYLLKITDCNSPIWRFEFQRLNEWHNPNEGAESKRLARSGFQGSVDGDRLDGLGVSSSFGDNDHEASGLSHKPTFTIHQKTLKQNEYAILIVATDGLSDSYTNEADILSSLKSYFHAGLESIEDSLAAEKFAFFLGEEAKYVWRTMNPSTKEIDDTSLVAIFTNNLPENMWVSGEAFDGHNGRSVSYNIGQFHDYVLETVAFGMYYNKPREKKSIVEEVQKLAAFKRIYQALHEGQSGLKSDNFLKSAEAKNINPDYLEQYAHDHPTHRRAKAWELAKLHYADKIPLAENAALFKEIYKYSLNNSYWGLFGWSKLFSTPTGSSEATCCNTLTTYLSRSFGAIFRSSKLENEFTLNEKKLIQPPHSNNRRQNYQNQNKKGIIELHQKEDPENRTARIVRGFSKRM